MFFTAKQYIIKITFLILYSIDLDVPLKHQYSTVIYLFIKFYVHPLQNKKALFMTKVYGFASIVET